MRRVPIFSWLIILLGIVYFFAPLIGTLEWSLRIVSRDSFSLNAYTNVLMAERFQRTFSFSFIAALTTIVVSVLLVAPTAYWVHLKLPRLRPWVEFVTLLTFVVPAIVLVFGIVRVYSRPPFSLMETEWGTNLLVIMGYTALSLPYTYRAVDTGLSAIDVRTLTEAAQSLGAGWGTIVFRVIFPNLRVALLSGAFLTFAVVMGEFTISNFILPGIVSFGPYMVNLNQTRPYEAAAVAIISFGLTWASIGVIQFLGRGAPGQLAGTR